MRNILVAAALLAGLSLPGATLRAEQLSASQEVRLPAWMAGAWEESEGRQWSEEYWSGPRAGLMIGASRSGSGGRLTLFEHMRIQRKPDSSLSLFAMPNGRAAIEFPMVSATADSMEFANPEHDFPQRVRYWREGALLRAEISLMDGSRRFGWTLAPMERR